MRRGSSKAQDKAQNQAELKRIILAIRKLLSRIEDAVPLINLAITASGASLSSTLPSTVSPSRLLQASTFLTAGDAQYGVPPFRPVQIGPTFTLSMYMLFLGHVRPQNEEDIRQSTWKEVIHKANVRLMRVPINAIYKLPGTRLPGSSGSPHGDHHDANGDTDGYFPSQLEAEGKADEYAYQLVIIEDLDDDRLHTFDDDEEQPGPCEGVTLAGIREAIPIHELSKIFYADTGKILNIGSEGEANSPVLLLKRDVEAVPPRRMMERYREEEIKEAYASSPSRVENLPGDGDHESASQLSLNHHQERETPASTTSQENALAPASSPWRLPPDLDPEWIAFEVYAESADSDTESELDTSTTKPSRKPSRTPSMDSQATAALSRLQLTSPPPSSPYHPPSPSETSVRSHLPAIQTSLSLLETILRLLSLQQFQQLPHLSIPDELLTFFLSESASTGSDGEDRKRLRNEARQRVGFDPYDESPVKRRGEEYQYQRQNGDSWTESDGYGGYENVSPSPAVAYDGFGSPLRYDEGYETHPWSRSPRPQPTPSPRTPPLLLKGQGQGASSRSSNSRNSSPLRWAGQRTLMGDREAARRGSPLARPGTGITDEGLGTSPASGVEAEEEEKRKIIKAADLQ